MSIYRHIVYMFIASVLIAITITGMNKGRKPTEKFPPIKKPLKKRKRSRNLKINWKPPEVKYTRTFPPIKKKD